jgi:shikimate dehydrogenase
MSRYALIGKNISHSQSPKIYKRLIGNHIQYDLLDYASSDLIPSADELFNSYDGINITSPYKKHFLNQIELTDNAKTIGAINCMKKIDGKIIGENTDFPAVVDIIKRYLDDGIKNIILLGDGVMAAMTLLVLERLNTKARQFSRKNTEDLSTLKLTEQDRQLIINSCSREFIYNGETSSNSIFWDYNYNNPKQSEVLKTKVYRYDDGLELLNLQAQYALAFWSAK